MKVVLTGYIKVPLDDLEDLKKHLDDHIKTTRNEQGCITFRVNQRDRASCIFDVYEEFTDSHSFHTHQKRVKGSTWGKLTKNVERVYKIQGLEKA